MKKVLLLAGLLSLAACQDASAPIAPQSPSRPVPGAAVASLAPTGARPGHHIVVFKNDVVDVPGLTAALVAAHNGVLEHTYRYAIKGFAAGLSDAAVAALRAHPEVAYIEPDQYVAAVTTEANATWGIDRIDQRNLPLDMTYSYVATGNGVNAYIIDTGIRTTHVEFGGRATSVFDAIGDGNGATDCNGHGTHVSGTVGGTTYGVAKSVRLFSVRVLDCTGSGSVAGVIAGVDWVTANHVSPSVANMSLGGPVSSSLDQAVRNSITSGVTYVIAAGNNNADACTSSPSRVTQAIIVGATGMTDARASFSNIGTCLDLFAPGVSITSSYNGSDTQTAVLNGTSMATPHVVGAVARYLELNPNAAPAAVETAITTNATLNTVTSPGTGSPNRLLYTGFIDGGGPPPNQPPVASFTTSCTNLACTFDASGSTDDVGITSRSWTFGDGGTAGNVVGPSHTYAAGGTYTVTLTVTDGGGLSNSTTRSVTVAAAANQPPVPSFTASCTNLTCTFDSSGSTDDVGIVNREWLFGDGSRLLGSVTTQKTYAAPGTYTVRLSVVDGGGLFTSITKQVTVTSGPVNQPPVASFTTNCTNLACTFDSSGSTDDVGITSRSWTFGDGGTAGNVVGPSHTYATGGTYTVTLTVTDGGGLSNSTTRSVTVTGPANQPPVASFTTSCTNLACTFDSSGSTDDVGITSRSWTFGDGGTAGNVVGPSHTYAAGGTYTVTLTVTDGGGLSNSTTRSVTVTAPVNQPPVPSFTVSCNGLTCTFDSSGSTDDVGIVNREWQFGDGTRVLSVVTVTKTYANPGTYLVRLNVIDGGGLWTTATQQVTVP